MKFAEFVLVVTCVTIAQADRDWTKIFPENEIKGNFKVANKNLRITGGEEATPNAYPWQVALFIPLPGGTAFCGGSLIAVQTVLTAARCLDAEIIGEIEVVLGAHRIRELEDTQVRFNTGQYLIFPNYNNQTLHNDIALVYLPVQVELNDYIQTIPLPTDGDLYREAMAVVTGWGKTSDTALTISPTLQRLDLRVITNTVCNILYLGQITDSQLCCNGESGRSTCDGDSGGALVYRGLQIGIVSFSVNHGCEAGYPPVFTRTSSFVVWINANLR